MGRDAVQVLRGLLLLVLLCWRVLNLQGGVVLCFLFGCVAATTHVGFEFSLVRARSADSSDRQWGPVSTLFPERSRQ